MNEIREELAAEVDRNWSSPWRSPDVFEAKVTARLSSHDEYRSLLDRTRQVEQTEAELVEKLGDASEDTEG